MNKKCAVFSCKGLGDGLIALVLSHQLQSNGCSVTTFHPFLKGLQEWFPSLPLSPFPQVEALSAFDHYFIVYEKSPWMQEILSYCQTHFPTKTHVLNPIATPKKDYPYWEEGRFNGNHTFVENLCAYVRDGAGGVLEEATASKRNGIIPPRDVFPRRFDSRVVMHPTSSREGKNWPKEKFCALAEELEKMGYEPAFILTPEEKEKWGDTRFKTPAFASLAETAAYVCESGAFIGNDSGIGHLASSLGLPTITICRSYLSGNFWRPAFAPNTLLVPSSFVPNLKGMRLRDKHWKKWISVKRVLNAFRELVAF